MANAQSFCSSAKPEYLTGVHVLGTDILKAALYVTTASIGAPTTAYSGTGEVNGTNYVAGGVVVTSGTPPSLSGTAGIFTPSAPLQWITVTLSTAFDCALVYNSSKSNKALSSHTFPPQTVTAGNFTLTMPVNAAGTALIQIT